MEVNGLKPVPVKDPVRHPQIQGPIEKEVKVSFQVHLNEMFVDLTKEFIKAASK